MEQKKIASWEKSFVLQKYYTNKRITNECVLLRVLHNAGSIPLIICIVYKTQSALSAKLNQNLVFFSEEGCIFQNVLKIGCDYFKWWSVREIHGTP